MINLAILPLFNSILIKMLPLYGVMALGFLYGRLHRKAAEPLAFLQIYFIAPIVVAASLANMEFQISYLWLPLITFLGCSVVATIAFFVFKGIWQDNRANLFSYACSGGNTGYFGVPVALILFPPSSLGLFMMIIIGFTLFENSFGYYLVARGNFTARDSFRKLIKLPTGYAFIIGVTLSALGWHLPDFSKEIIRDFRGCYIIMGALMIGLGLSRVEKFSLESKLITVVFGLKFILWPLFALLIIACDLTFLHIFTPNIHKMMLLVASVPLPANAIPYAMQLNVQPERASTLVFLSTLFALLYVPFVMILYSA